MAMEAQHPLFATEHALVEAEAAACRARAQHILSLLRTAEHWRLFVGECQHPVFRVQVAVPSEPQVSLNGSGSWASLGDRLRRAEAKALRQLSTKEIEVRCMEIESGRASVVFSVLQIPEGQRLHCHDALKTSAPLRFFAALGCGDKYAAAVREWIEAHADKKIAALSEQIRSAREEAAGVAEHKAVVLARLDTPGLLNDGPQCDCDPAPGFPHRESCPVAEESLRRQYEAIGRAGR